LSIAPPAAARQIGRKGESNWRWVVSLKLCWLVNRRDQVVAWSWDRANVSDQVFLPLVAAVEERCILLAGVGFNRAQGIPVNLRLCRRSTWNERMQIAQYAS
jgi:hypothetical protein